MMIVFDHRLLKNEISVTFKNLAANCFVVMLRSYSVFVGYQNDSIELVQKPTIYYSLFK